MATDPWMRNLDAFTQAMGVENAPIIFSMARVPFKDDDERDQFIKELTGTDLRETKIYG